MIAAWSPAHRAAAQPPVTSLLDTGDRERADRQPAAALAAYEAALDAAPNNYGALWRTSSALIDVSEFDTNKERRKAAFSRAADLARRAVSLRPDSAAGYFELSRALGRQALSVSARERTGYALDVREAALKTLSIDSLHAGAMHVLGRWNAEVMRLNGFTRMIAKTFLGGKVFGEASWDNAIRLLERAVQIEPNRTVHLLALGEVYRDAGNTEKARATLNAAIRAPLHDPNDEAYKREAKRTLDTLDAR